MSQNPYAPPQNDYSAPQYDIGYGDNMQMPASTGQRFANFMIDSIVRTAISYIFIFGLAALDLAEAAVFITFPVIICYYWLFEYFFGWTPGKLVTGTRVVSNDGSKLTLWRALGRTMCRFVPFEPFSFLSGPPGWHDSWSNTVVIVKPSF